MFGAATLLSGGGTSGLLNILQNATNFMGAAGKILIVLFGLVMVIGGVFQIAKGMLGGQRAQVNWVMAIGLILVGGALAFSGGFTLLKNFSNQTNATLTDFSNAPKDYGGTESFQY